MKPSRNHILWHPAPPSSACGFCPHSCKMAALSPGSVSIFQAIRRETAKDKSTACQLSLWLQSGKQLFSQNLHPAVIILFTTMSQVSCSLRKVKCCDFLFLHFLNSSLHSPCPSHPSPSVPQRSLPHSNLFILELVVPFAWASFAQIAAQIMPSQHSNVNSYRQLYLTPHQTSSHPIFISF